MRRGVLIEAVARATGKASVETGCCFFSADRAEDAGAALDLRRASMAFFIGVFRDFLETLVISSASAASASFSGSASASVVLLAGSSEGENGAQGPGP